MEMILEKDSITIKHSRAETEVMICTSIYEMIPTLQLDTVWLIEDNEDEIDEAIAKIKVGDEYEFWCTYPTCVLSFVGRKTITDKKVIKEHSGVAFTSDMVKELILTVDGKPHSALNIILPTNTRSIVQKALSGYFPESRVDNLLGQFYMGCYNDLTHKFGWTNYD